MIETTQRLHGDALLDTQPARDRELDDPARRTPFTLRVAVTWSHLDDVPDADDGALRFFRRAPLTGEIVTTAGGADVRFSDLEVA